MSSFLLIGICDSVDWDLGFRFDGMISIACHVAIHLNSLSTGPPRPPFGLHHRHVHYSRNVVWSDGRNWERHSGFANDSPRSTTFASGSADFHLLAIVELVRDIRYLAAIFGDGELCFARVAAVYEFVNVAVV